MNMFIYRILPITLLINIRNIKVVLINYTLGVLFYISLSD